MHLKVHLHLKHMPYIASYINMNVSKKYMIQSNVMNMNSNR